MLIKERIVQLIEYKGIPKEEFYVKIGMTSANFRGAAKKTPLNSNAIENILSEIPDANIEWIVTGRGSMLKKNEYPIIEATSLSVSELETEYHTSFPYLEKTIYMQQKRIDALIDLVEEKNQKIEDLLRNKKNAVANGA